MEKGDKDLELIIERLTQRVKELEDINEGHRQLNGRLRVELNMWKQIGSELEKTKNLLQGYKSVINELSNKLRQKDS
jgi:predicted RNase H-like nuclease (RuvC/YqgF family)